MRLYQALRCAGAGAVVALCGAQALAADRRVTSVAGSVGLSGPAQVVPVVKVPADSDVIITDIFLYPASDQASCSDFYRLILRVGERPVGVFMADTPVHAAGDAKSALKWGQGPVEIQFESGLRLPAGSDVSFWVERLYEAGQCTMRNRTFNFTLSGYLESN